MAFHVACYIQGESYSCQVEQLYEQGQTIGTRIEASPFIGKLEQELLVVLIRTGWSKNEGVQENPLRRPIDREKLTSWERSCSSESCKGQSNYPKIVATYDCSKILQQPWTLQASPIVSTEQDRVNKVR